jgi:hypothetical protein
LGTACDVERAATRPRLFGWLKLLAAPLVAIFVLAGLPTAANAGGINFAKGEVVDVHNGLSSPFLIRSDNQGFQSLGAGSTLTFDTGGSNLSVIMCWGQATTKKAGGFIERICTPDLTVRVRNPEIGFPTFSMSPGGIDSVPFRENQAQTFAVTVGQQRLNVGVIRLADLPTPRPRERSFNLFGHKHWLLTIRPG